MTALPRLCPDLLHLTLAAPCVSGENKSIDHTVAALEIVMACTCDAMKKIQSATKRSTSLVQMVESHTHTCDAMKKIRSATKRSPSLTTTSTNKAIKIADEHRKISITSEPFLSFSLFFESETRCCCDSRYDRCFYFLRWHMAQLRSSGASQGII